MTRILGILLIFATVASAQPKARRETTIQGRAVSAWTKDLKDGKPETHIAALNALMRAGPEARSAVPVLLKYLEGESSLVQVLVVLTLAKIGPDATPSLRKALDARSPRVRELAARALGSIGDASATPNLVAVLSDGEATVRRSALEALRQLDARAAVPAIRKSLGDPDPETRVEAAWALWRISKDTAGLSALRDASREKEEIVITKALTALGTMLDKAREAGPDVVGLFKHTNPEIRFLAAAIHHRITGDDQGVEVVAAGMKESETRSDAVAALAPFAGSIKGKEQAVALLKDAKPAIRREAATYAPAELLAQGMDDPDFAVRWWSALGLLASGSVRRDGEDELILTLRGVNDSNVDTILAVRNRERAVAMLATILTKSSRWQSDAVRLLSLPGIDARPALDILLEQMSSEDPSTRQAVADALAGIGPEVLPLLRKRLDAVEPRVRESAVRAVGRLGVAARSLTPSLLARIRDSDAGVRAASALALWWLEGESDLPLTVLELVLKDVDNLDRWQAVEAIGIIASEARPAIKGLTELLVNALKDRDARVRVMAARWLWRRVKQSKPVVPLLRDVLADRDSLARLMAAETLGELDTEANTGPTLLNLLEDRDGAVRLAAVEGLVRLNDRPALLKALEGSKRTREAARLAFSRLGLRRAAADYLDALDRKDEATQTRLRRLLVP